MPGPGFHLAHLSDPHLPFDPGSVRFRAERLTIKQRMALQSWLRKRRLVSTMAPDRALRADLAATGADHVAVTGDLVNLGVPSEYERARDWLDRLGPPDAVSVVPGNHDLTAAEPALAGLALWQPFMRGDAPDKAVSAPFPFLRVRGELALIGLCSGVTTRPGSAAGRLGHQQIASAAALLQQTRGLFRVVMIHHPPALGPGGPRKALRDRVSLRRILHRHGAELVLHGHHHRASLASVPGPSGPIPVFGVPAALAVVPRPEIGGWLSHRVSRSGANWRLSTTLRSFDPDADRFSEQRAWENELPAQ